MRNRPRICFIENARRYSYGIAHILILQAKILGLRFFSDTEKRGTRNGIDLLPSNHTENKKQDKINTLTSYN